MKNKSEIKDMLVKTQIISTAQINFDEEAILAEYQEQDDNQSSTAIKILSVIGGFLGTLAFVGFLLLLGLGNSEFGLLVTGVLFASSAIVLNRKTERLILDTFSISAYIVGLVLITISFLEMDVNENIVVLFIMILAGISLWLTQNYMLSFISILVISVGLLLLLVFINESYHLIHLYSILITLGLTYVFLFEAKIINSSSKLAKLYDPLQIGMVVSFLFSLAFFGTKTFHRIHVEFEWFFSMVLFANTIFIISKILDVLEVTNTNTKIMVYVLSGAILLTTAFSPSILGAILLVLLSFYVNYKIGFSIGVVALIYFVSQYYYDLHFTLLTKSILLFSSGLLFIALYLFITKSIKNEKV